MAVVLITGCSSGFGLETALAFARNGDTAVATMRDPDKAGDLRSRAEAEGLEVPVEKLDVTDDESVRSCVQTVGETYGPVDVLVNNAGIGGAGPVETIPLDVAQSLVDTNLFGCWRMIQAVLPSMRERRTGVIVNVGSIAGRIPGTLYNSAYAASKAALGALSESLKMEVEPFGIGVVNIEPGFFSTAITDNAADRADGIDGSPYEADFRWFRSFTEQGVEGGADPSGVADRIVAAAADPSTLHQPVGDDAEMYLALLDGTDSFEGWIDTALPVVEDAVGPRPEPA